MPSKKPRRKPRASSLYPQHHDSVSQLLGEANLRFDFYEVDDSDTWVKEHDTNIMGKFRCYNKNCHSKGWTSKSIAITIRMYPNQRYNAKVYFQRCLQCNWLSKPILDGSYAERIAYRLKKWNGVRVEERESTDRIHRGPHQSHLCEGCKVGHCKLAMERSVSF